MCVFLSNSTAQKCFGQIIEPRGRVFNVTAISRYPHARTENVCTEVEVAQNSTLFVYDVDSTSGQLSDDPAYFEILPNGELLVCDYNITTTTVVSLQVHQEYLFVSYFVIHNTLYAVYVL